MALSVSPRLGSEVPIPNPEGFRERVLASWDPGHLWLRRLRGCGVERATGSRACGDDGSAKEIDLRPGRPYKGSNCNATVPPVSVVEEALLGKSLLGKGLLCGYSRIGRGHDT